MSKSLTEGDWKAGTLEIHEDVKPIAPPRCIRVEGLHWFSAKTPPKTDREILMYFGDGILISGEYCDGMYSTYGKTNYHSCEVIAWSEMIETPTQYGTAKVGQ